MELEERCGYLDGEAVTTLYFGGGTPSLLSPEEIEGLVDKVKSLFGVTEFEEVTLEANPEDLTEDYLERLAGTGVDRLSIGVQSFCDSHLSFFNRRHDGETARNSILNAKKAGFRNITVDLIYGVPQMSMAEWGRNLDTFLELGLPHLSAYHLTIEPQTIFGKRAEKGKLNPVADEVSEAHYGLLEEKLSAAGFAHYEVSNFARPGFEGIHNGNYWKGKKYLGIGPSAHSFDGKSRRWNVRSNPLYIRNFSAGEYFESETLSRKDRFNEYMMTRLRTAKGVSLDEINTLFGAERATEVKKISRKFLDNGTIIEREGMLFIPPVSFLQSDYVIGEFFWI